MQFCSFYNASFLLNEIVYNYLKFKLGKELKCSEIYDRLISELKLRNTQL